MSATAPSIRVKPWQSQPGRAQGGMVGVAASPALRSPTPGPASYL